MREKSFSNVMNVRKLSLRAPPLQSTGEFIQEKNPISARFVERPLVMAHPLLVIKDVTLARSLMSVLSAGKPSYRTRPLFVTGGTTTQGRNPLIALIVGRPLVTT